MSANPGAYYRILPERLLEARRAMFLSQDRLANVAGLTRDTVMDLEHGRGKYGSQPFTVRALAGALGVAPLWLLGREIPQETSGDPAENGQELLGKTSGEHAENERGDEGEDLKALALGVDLEVSTQITPRLELAPKATRRGKPYSPSVKALVAWWRNALDGQGVTVLAQDFTLKGCAVVDKALRSGLAAEDVMEALEWGWAHDWFADKLHEPGKMNDLIPQWQQRHIKALAVNGKASPHRLDQHMARLREMTNGR